MKRKVANASELWRLFCAIAAGDANEVSRLLESAPHLVSDAEPVGASRGSPTSFFLQAIKHNVYAGHTALHVAAAAYETDIARKLVAIGADVGAKNRRGAQPIHAASVGAPGSGTWNPEAQATIVTYLLSEGADPNAADNSGVAPLHRAVRTRNAPAVRVLLAHGADSRRRNGSGSTPLHLAVQNTGRGGSGTDAAREQQREIIRLLVQHGGRPSDRDGHGKSVTACITSEWVADIMKESRGR